MSGETEVNEVVKCSTCGDVIGNGHVDSEVGLKCIPCQFKEDIGQLEAALRDTREAYIRACRALHERCAGERLTIVKLNDMGGVLKGACFLFTVRPVEKPCTFASTRSGIYVCLAGGPELPLATWDPKAFLVQIPRALKP